MRSTDILNGILLTITLGLSNQALAQDDSGLTVQRLSDSISVLFGTGGNIGVFSGPDGTFIIDDQYSGSGEQISAAVARISELPISYVLNTHWHFDHAGSNDYFGHNGAVIIGHDNVRKMLIRGGYFPDIDWEEPPAPPAALPVITFDDSLTLHLNGEEIHMFHVTAGHTDGDGIIWFKNSNVIHMGDNFLAGIYPLVDVISGGSMDGMITTVDTVLAFTDDETQIIPGHGPVSTRADLQAYRDMCVELRDRVAERKNRGMSLEEVLEENFTSDLDERWNGFGDAFKRRSIRSIYLVSP
jgi:glyoxylase-like metal-dependent hydrolase (beta-lactamase superfamily II)